MINSLEEFRENTHKTFYEILISKEILNQEDAEALEYALQDISESIEEIYSLIIPKILNNSNESKDFILNLLWDIRENFRHIQYHIDDGKLTSL